MVQSGAATVEEYLLELDPERREAIEEVRQVILQRLPDGYQEAMAFGMISLYLAQRGMVLVDTKTEHGINADGRIVAADELYTMDSSRFWKLDDRGELLTRDGKPVSFSKEFARGMVNEKGQQFSEEQAGEIAVRYIQGLQLLTGETFTPDLRPRDQRIIESTNLVLDTLL